MITKESIRKEVHQKPKKCENCGRISVVYGTIEINGYNVIGEVTICLAPDCGIVEYLTEWPFNLKEEKEP